MSKYEASQAYLRWYNNDSPVITAEETFLDYLFEPVNDWVLYLMGGEL